MSAATSIHMVPAPREAVLAAAGSGKTFRISSRIIGLLAHGQPIESVLASTFTRKAAGQILETVLERLAEAATSDEKASELARFATLSEHHPLPAEPAFWRGHLQQLVRFIHRASVGTLDSFFIGVARSFVHELGLPSGWGIAEGTKIKRLRSEALQEVLQNAEREEILALLTALNRGEVRRSVHDYLLGKLDRLLVIHDSLDPYIDDPWGAFRKTGDSRPLSPEEVEQLAQRFESIDLPRTKTGSPRAVWVNAIGKATDALRERDWLTFFGTTLCQRAMTGDLEFGGASIGEDVCACVDAARLLAGRDLRPQFSDEIEAIGRLTRDFAKTFRERQGREGTFEFQDVTRLLADGADPLGGRADLYYRLDARVQHLLLDEFQDTSLAQWEAIAPIVDEVLSDPGDRAGVIVADPKQSIYGWRGGEPAIVHHIQQHYALERVDLNVSWRSSQVVLDFVNHVFGDVANLPVMKGDATWAEAAAEWQRDFEPHTAAPPNETMAGYVEVTVGPREGGRGQKAEPSLCRHTAQRVRELYDAMPNATITVLTRGNLTVARMIHELKLLGVYASEEGGTALTDSAGCEAILALLHMADHPGDTVARYHVAKSPLGEALGYTDPAEIDRAGRLSQEVRAELAHHGYGRTIDRWIDLAAASCNERELRRLSQLAEMGHRFDGKGAVRPTEFVRQIESERVEDPTTARVRVMTVHQSKGLQFDVVVLPELEGGLGRSTGEVALPYRPSPTGRTTAVMPYVNSTLRPLFPEVEAAYAQASASRLRDDLSTLYVATTRSKYALHVILRADGENGPGEGKTVSRIIREALAGRSSDLPPITEGEILYESGDPDWYQSADRLRQEDGQKAREKVVDVDRIRLRQPSTRRRMLPRRSPSSLEGGEAVVARDVLRLDNRAAFDRGSLVHAWCELIEWIEDGVPTEEELRTAALKVAPDISAPALAELLEMFGQSMRNDEVRRALSRSSYPAGATAHREVPFVHREGDRLVEGYIDRLVLSRENGRFSRAEIIDFKTDAIPDEESLQRRVEFYIPQMQAYWRAVQVLYRLPADAVTVKLVFMQLGEVVGMAPAEH